MIVEIIAEDNSFQQLTFTITVQESQESHQITIRSTCNLLEDFFQGLSLLQWKDSLRYTSESLVGTLVGCEEGLNNLCGAVLPLHALKTLCLSALSCENLLGYLRVCSCYIPNLTTAYSKDQITGTTGSIQVPSRNIWTLLILAELFGNSRIMYECNIRMLNMLMKQDLLACSDCNVTVPCLLVDDSITSRDVECIRKKLIAHYLMYGPSALSSYSPNNSFANTGASAAINSSTQVGQSSTAQGGRVNEVYESKSNIIKDRVDVTTPQPSRTNHNTPTSAATTISSITNHETPASQLHDSVSYDHPVVCHYSYSPLSPEELEISDTITDNEFTFMDDEEGVYPLSSSTTPCSIRNISHSDESSFAIPVRSSSFGTRQNNYESEPVNEMHLDEQLESIHRRPSHSTKKHLQHFVQQERDEAYYLDYSPKVIDKDNFGTQRFMIANQLISNSGRRQLDGSHNFAHLQDHSTEDHRELSPNQSTDRSMSINELSGIKPPRSVSPQLSHRKSSPAFGSITPTNRIPSRHESPSSVSSSRDDSSVSNLISRESRHFRMVDSHLARELSLQRIREVKVRQELENSKLEAEKALRDSRLKSLEIRSSMARMRSSSDSRSTTPLKYRSTGRSITQEEYEEQTLLAEKARIRAAIRVKEKKEEQKIRGQKESLERTIKEREKWKKRDEQILKSKSRQSVDTINDQLKKEKKTSCDTINSTNNGSSAVSKSAKSASDARRTSKISNTTKSINSAISSQGITKIDTKKSSTLANCTNRKDQSNRYQQEESPCDDFPPDNKYDSAALNAIGKGFSPAYAKHMSTNKSQLLDDATQVGLLIGAEFNQNSVLRPKLDTSESFNKQENRMKRKSLAESKVDMVTIKIIRAWDLFEALGGTNAYVIVDWGKFGRSSTQAVVNSVDPYFGATLRFKSPFRKADDADIISNLGKDMVSIKGEVYYSTACPIRVYLYHRNESIVDELLGEAEVDPIDVATIEGTSVLYLYDRISKSNAGCLELSMLLN